MTTQQQLDQLLGLVNALGEMPARTDGKQTYRITRMFGRRVIERLTVDLTPAEAKFFHRYYYAGNYAEIVSLTERLTITKVLRDAKSEAEGLEMLMVWYDLIEKALKVAANYPDMKATLTVKKQMIEARF